MHRITVSPMANTPVFSMRLPTGIKGALSVISRDERRSVANLINKVMEDYIEQHGMMLCPECNGHGLGPMVDEEDEPNLCETCDGLGYVKNAALRSKSTISDDVLW